MKKHDVKVGTVYRVKVSGSVQDVRITGENPHGGWDGVNVATNRSVRIKSAQRLRAVAAGERPAKRKKVVSLAEYEAQAKGEQKTKGDVAATVAAVEHGNLADGLTIPTAGKKRRTTAAEKTAKPAKTSGLDAAAAVLAEAGEPLNTTEMVKRMLEKGLWTTGGKTPASTIYAAILRECATKGDQSRFRKVARGKFELAK